MKEILEPREVFEVKKGEVKRVKMNKTHGAMSRFGSAEDVDFKKLVRYLIVMAEEARKMQ